jgi:hypothetical protein
MFLIELSRRFNGMSPAILEDREGDAEIEGVSGTTFVGRDHGE